MIVNPIAQDYGNVLVGKQLGGKNIKFDDYESKKNKWLFSNY